MRPTLAVFLLTGNLLSIAALAIIGHFGVSEIVLALTLIPGTLLGYFASSRLLSRLAPAILHKGVLLISTASALAALAPHIL